MKPYLHKAEFTFVFSEYGEVKVMCDATGEFNKHTRSMYYTIRILLNGYSPQIGQKSITSSSFLNKTNALRWAKELLNAQ